MQSAMPAWPPAAVHDTVAAVLRTAPYRRSAQTTMLERLLGWLGQGLEWLSRLLGGLPGGRTAVTWITAVIAALVIGRLLLAAHARDPHATPGRTSRGSVRDEDPWRAAERLAALGDHEGAAHALYRGVLASIARQERLRLHPSKTSGDYARELRARGSGAWQPFRAFARRFDDGVYGHHPLDAALVAELLRLAAPLRTGARAA